MAKKYCLAWQLIGKPVITNKGEDLGKLNDILVDERTGDIESLMVQPNRTSTLAANLSQNGGMISVPYKSVFAISQLVVVDESMLV